MHFRVFHGSIIGNRFHFKISGINFIPGILLKRAECPQSNKSSKALRTKSTSQREKGHFAPFPLAMAFALACNRPIAPRQRYGARYQHSPSH